jgi:predicted nuclease with TOPRIM domain
MYSITNTIHCWLLCAEANRDKLELEFALKKCENELQKLRPENDFYKSSVAEVNEHLRRMEKEKATLEQQLARSAARVESMEIQLRDKEEVRHTLSPCCG